MSTGSRVRTFILTVMLALGALVTPSAAVGRSPSDAEAYGVTATGPITLHAAPTVALARPRDGRDASARRVEHLGISASGLGVAVRGGESQGFASSSASVDRFALTTRVRGVVAELVSAHGIRAAASTTCDTENRAESVGAASVAELRVLGRRVVLTGEPGQVERIDVADAPGPIEIRLNDQVERLRPGRSALRVTSLRVTVSTPRGQQEIAVGGAASAIVCPGGKPGAFVLSDPGGGAPGSAVAAEPCAVTQPFPSAACEPIQKPRRTNSEPVTLGLWRAQGPVSGAALLILSGAAVLAGFALMRVRPVGNPWPRSWRSRGATATPPTGAKP